MKPTIIVAPAFSPTFTADLVQPLSKDADLEIVHYPGVGGTPGVFTPETATTAIVDAALRVRQRNPLPPLYVFGYSMGGLFTLQAAVKMGPSLNGVLLAAPLVSREAAEQTAIAQRQSLWTQLEYWIGRQAEPGPFLKAFFEIPPDLAGPYWAKKIKCHTFAVHPVLDDLITPRHYDLLTEALGERFEKADIPANHLFHGAGTQLNARLADYVGRSMKNPKWWHHAPKAHQTDWA